MKQSQGEYDEDEQTSAAGPGTLNNHRVSNHHTRGNVESPALAGALRTGHTFL